MGVSTKELFKMMEQGQIMTDEFLPKFSKELRKAVREGGALGAALNTSRVAMNRFGTAFKLNVLDSFEAGADSGLGIFFNELTYTLEELSPAFKILGAVFGKVMGAFGTSVHLVYQFIRPFVELTYTLGSLATELGFLKRIVHLFIGAITLIPGALQWLNNELEDAHPALKIFGYLIQAVAVGLLAWGTKGKLLKVFFTVLTGGLNYTIPLLISFIRALMSGASASAILASSVGVAGNTMMAVFSKVLKHPIFAAITLLGLAMQQIADLSADPKFNAMVDKANTQSAQDGNLSTWEKASNYIMNAYAAGWAKTGEILGTTLGMNPESSNSKQINNYWQIKSDDPDALASKIGGILNTQLEDSYTQHLNPAGG